MKVKKASLPAAFGDTLRLYKAHAGTLLLMVLLQLLFRAFCLTPLLFLAVPAARWLALLCLPLYVLIVLPARQNAAEAFQALLENREDVLLHCISTENYGRKLMRGLKGMGLMILWLLPPVLAIGALVAGFKGMDGVSFFILLGTLANGDYVLGTIRALLIVLALCLVPLIGCAFHSGTRHAFALGEKKLLRGQRGRVFLLWLLGLVTVLPLAIAAVLLLRGYAGSVINAFKTFDFESLAMPWEPLAQLALWAIPLMLPLLPVKSLLPAVYLRQVKDAKEAPADAAA